MSVLKDVVSIEGVVRLLTDTGVFLWFQNRTVFLDDQYISAPLAKLVRDETVTLNLSREYARRKGLVG
jgi:hypothetical protein